MEGEQRTLLLKELLAEAKQLRRASDGLLGKHCETAALGASLTSLHCG